MNLTGIRCVPGSVLRLPVLILVAATPSVAQTFVIQHQETGGSYVDVKGRTLAEKATEIPGTRLRTTCLMALAILGDGSTMRSGPYKAQVRNAVRWLIRQIDDEGRIGLDSHPDWFTDHALATFTIAEAARLSNYKTLDRRLAETAGYLHRYLATKGVTVTPELAFFGRAVVESIRGLDATAFPKSRVLQGPLSETLIPHERRLAERDRKSDLEEAIHLLRVVRFERKTTGKAALEQLLERASARREEIATMHPQAAAFYSLALYQMSGERWKTWQKALETLVVKRQLRDGPAQGSWRAPSATIGPMQTTAWRTITEECYYRYIRTILIE